MKCQLSAITAMFNSIILNQFDQMQAVSTSIDFGPLVKAARGETVPKNELKSAVIKAIDILMGNDPTDHLNSALNVARRLLQEDIQKSGDIA